MDFVSRAGDKLEFALRSFAIPVATRICADFGSNIGGFVDCLLKRGAAKVYAIDTGYGVLDWKLRNDPRVVVMERTNAMHVQLPEEISLLTIDVAWTRQRAILPAALRVVAVDGDVVSLIKPQYEADRALLREGVLPDDKVDAVLGDVKRDISNAGFRIVSIVQSPIRGSGGNVEHLAWLKSPGS